MKYCLAVVGIVSLGAHLTPMDDFEEFEPNLKDSLMLLCDLTEALKPVKDHASAKSALPKVKAINTRLAALKKKDEKTLRLPEYGAMRTKYGAKFEAALKALDAELVRSYQVLDFGSPLREGLDHFKDVSGKMHVMTEAKASAAMVQVSTIDKALQAYKSKTGAYPESLPVLTQGKDALLKDKDLWDPWGRMYNYDLSGPLNEGKKPDVWCEIPAREKVGNWKNK